MQITWLGHAAFRVEYAGKVLLIDPFFTGNPAFSADRGAVTRGVTHILVTHAHSDHVGDTVDIAKQTGASVITNYALCGWLGSQGVDALRPLNLGGTTDAGGVSVTMVRADHSSSLVDMGTTQPVGPAAGLIVKAPGEKTLYHLGDTDIFSDMALIAEIHKPQVGLVPIGDLFTMGPVVAAMATQRYFRFETVIPTHYASFPPLEANPDPFVAAMQGAATKVLVPQNGKAVEL